MTRFAAMPGLLVSASTIPVAAAPPRGAATAVATRATAVTVAGAPATADLVRRR